MVLLVRSRKKERQVMEYIHGGDIYTYGDVIDYSVNLNPFGPGESVLTAMEDGLRHVGEYPDSRCRVLRKTLAEYLHISEEFLIFGNGAAELIFLLVQTIRPKKAVLTIPSFAEYDRALQAVECERVYYSLCEEDGFVPEESYLDLLTEEVDLIFLCSPDNPSGAVIEKDFLLRILEKCKRNQILMVLDECFVEFLSDPQKQTLYKECQNTQNLVVLQAFTKISAIPGIRIGYGITSNQKLIRKMERNRQPWSVSGVAQVAGCAALQEMDRWQRMREWLQAERTWLEENLTRIGVDWFPSKVNYLLLKSSYPLFSLLLEEKILIRDCSNYEGLQRGYYRIAVKQRKDNEKLLAALTRIYEGRDM